MIPTACPRFFARPLSFPLGACSSMRAQFDRRLWPGERRGFALIAALWLLVGFATVGAVISVHARGRRLSAANSLDEDRGRAATEAGLEHARSKLARLIVGNAPSAQVILPSSIQDPWRDAPLLIASTTTLGDERYRVSIRD